MDVAVSEKLCSPFCQMLKSKYPTRGVRSTAGAGAVRPTEWYGRPLTTLAILSISRTASVLLLG